MSIRFIRAVCILYTLQLVLNTFADGNNSTGNSDCGIPPCREGCYYKATDLAGNEVATCTIAPVGYYSPGDETLYPCPKGTYAPFQGSGICIVCPIGTSAPLEGSDICAPCDEGLYAAVPGLVECNKCNPSKYFGPGSTAVTRENDIEYCVDPNDNEFECGNSTGPCTGRCYIVGNISMTTTFTKRSCSIVPKGYYSPHNDELLYVCPAGTYSLQGSNDCTVCAPGSMASNPASESCQLCPESTYASNFGATSCSDCNSSLYFGFGSNSVFRDERKNISYCLKPIQITSEYPSIAPTDDSSVSPLFSPRTKIPSSQRPSIETVEITVHPTSIFDLISESTRSPQQEGSDSSSPMEIFINGTTSRSDPLRDIPKPLRYIIFVVVVLLMLLSISYRWCYRRRPKFCRRPRQEQRNMYHRQTSMRMKTFARTPPADIVVPISYDEDEATASSPTFPVPKIISTTKIISNHHTIDNDEESEIDIYIEDDSVM